MENLLYIGMDVHKDTISMSVYSNKDKSIILEKTIPNDRPTILRFMAKRGPVSQIVSGYEAGCVGFDLYRLLSTDNIECHVIAPGKIARRPSDRVKTDRKDARLLAMMLKNGDYESIYVPSAEVEADRDFLRSRDQIRRETMAVRKKLLSFLLRHGIKYPTGKHWTQRHWIWLRKLKLNSTILQITFESYISRLSDIEVLAESMDIKLKEIALSEKYKESVERLRCFRGIDYYSALSLLVEIDNFKRFPTAMSFMNFLGLVPSEHTSGKKRKQGSITKTGNSFLRRMLIECSWSARIKSYSSMYMQKKYEGQKPEIILYVKKAAARLYKKYYKLLHRGKLSTVAVTAVAREFAGFIWGMMTENYA